LACGAQGHLGNAPFKVNGLSELSDRTGLWRSWHLEVDLNAVAWLQERDGEVLLVAVGEQLDAGLDFDHLNPGAELDLGDEHFLVERRRVSTVCASQGLTSQAPGDEVVWVQLRSANQRLWLQFHDGYVQVHEVSTVELHELGLHRPLQAVGALGEQRCPQCAAAMFRVAESTWFGRCPGCHSLLDFSGQEVGVLEAASVPRDKPPLTTLKLGAEGKLLGAKYIILAAYGQTSHLEGYSVHRTEYLLYNRQHRYLWLSEHDDGQWFVREQSAEWPKADGRHAWLQGTKFDFSVNHVATVDQVAGALVQLVDAGESLHHLEYTASGLGGGMREGVVLLRRASDEELVWEVCNPVEPEDVAKAFDVTLPQPVVHKPKPKPVVRTTLRDLAAPLRLAAYGNLVMLVLHPTFLGLALGAVSLVGIGSMCAFSWLLEGEKL
jgi:hypothetical protein